MELAVRVCDARLTESGVMFLVLATHPCATVTNKLFAFIVTARGVLLPSALDALSNVANALVCDVRTFVISAARLALLLVAAGCRRVFAVSLLQTLNARVTSYIAERRVATAMTVLRALNALVNERVAVFFRAVRILQALDAFGCVRFAPSSGACTRAIARLGPTRSANLRCACVTAAKTRDTGRARGRTEAGSLGTAGTAIAGTAGPTDSVGREGPTSLLVMAVIEIRTTLRRHYEHAR
jgi:hypothetical protein